MREAIGDEDVLEDLFVGRRSSPVDPGRLAVFPGLGDPR
jgi:hypothetical protein